MTDDFEDLFNAEFSQHDPVTVSNIQYIDDNTNFVTAELVTSGRATRISTHQSDGKGVMIRSLQKPEQPLEFKLVAYASGEMIYSWGSNLVILPEYEQVMLLERQYRQLNADYHRRAHRLSLRADDIVAKASSQLEAMIDAFVQRYYPIEMVDIFCFSQLENKILNESSIWLEDELPLDKFDRERSIALFAALGDEQARQSYQKVIEKFELLTRLIDQKIDIDANVLMLATYRLLWKGIQRFVARTWGKRYAQVFDARTEDTLDGFVASFMKISEIDTSKPEHQDRLTMYLFSQGVFESGKSWGDACADVGRKITDYEHADSLSDFEQSLFSPEEKIAKVTIQDTDLMSGLEFESLIQSLFDKMGYSTRTTETTGDQGIDIICIKNGVRLGIQAKCYTNNVGNAAIQELVSGLGFYQLSEGIVVTNSYFTSSAIALARANNVKLWNREELKEMINRHL